MVRALSVSSHNPSVSQYVTFKAWEDIDMVYQLSYLNKRADGLNVNFEVKYLPTSDSEVSKASLAPVRKADASVLIPGDKLENKTFKFNCGFQ
jgi:hypothetical protein